MNKNKEKMHSHLHHPTGCFSGVEYKQNNCFIYYIFYIIVFD